MVTETSSTGRDSDKFMLRLPDGMRDTLKEQAKSNNRTLNAEIIARLESSLGGSAGASAEQIVKEMEFVRHMYERESKAQSASQKILAELLRATTTALEEAGVDGDLIRVARSMADGILDSDASKLVEAYADLFPKLKGTAVVKELQEVDAKRKRGEDITSFMEKFVDEQRANWESNSAEKSPPAKKSVAAERIKG